jgi:tetratricopeptide (TPR) repeat protein
VGRTPTPDRAQTPSTSPVRAPTNPRQPYGRLSSSPPMLARGTRDSVPPIEQTKTDPELAAEAAERANRALASDKPEAAVLELKKAVELVPNNVDYNALLGWALFCAADDKFAVATESRKLLEKAVYKSQQPEVAHFYLGRVERILGRDKEALRHFHAVLDVLPNHRDASAEVRVIEARLKRLGIAN